jgi:NADPH-dependent curcumin reductase CurA
VKDELGLACIDYKAGNLAGAEGACAGGVDVYFDNVGGEIPTPC